MVKEQVGIFVRRGPAGEFLKPQKIVRGVRLDEETEKFDKRVEDLFVNHILDYLRAKDEMKQRQEERRELLESINRQKAQEMQRDQ